MCISSKPESYSCSRVERDRIPEWEVEAQLHEFLTSAIDGGKWSVSRFSCFNPGRKAPDNHRMCTGTGLALGLTQIPFQKYLHVSYNPTEIKWPKL